jgi:hypothetical protein
MADALTEANRVADLTDDQLIKAWNAGVGNERLTAHQRAVIDEMARRGLAF